MSFDGVQPKMDALVKKMKGTDEADALAAGEEFIALVLPILHQGNKANQGDVLGIMRMGSLIWLNRLTKQYNDLKARYDNDIRLLRSEIAALESQVKYIENKEVNNQHT